MLAEVNLAEEGVLQLLLASVHRLSSRTGNDNEVTMSSKYVLLPGNSFVMAMNYINKLGLSFEIQFIHGNNVVLCLHFYLLNCNVQKT